MSLSPGSDFYTYVNAEWQRRIHMPEHESSYNVSDEVEYKINERVLRCIETCTRKTPSHPLSVFIASITTKTNNNVNDMNSYIRLLDTLKTDDEIGYAMGILNTLMCSPPIDIQINNNCSGKCCIFIGEATLGLPTKHYYTQVDSMTLYKSYLSSIGELFHIPHFQKIVDIERRFLDTIRKKRICEL